MHRMCLYLSVRGFIVIIYNCLSIKIVIYSNS
nr:MAG TPA: hypothetical protein [Caudoviricetes sp.]